jgi:hypothetical protein
LISVYLKYESVTGRLLLAEFQFCSIRWYSQLNYVTILRSWIWKEYILHWLVLEIFANCSVIIIALPCNMKHEAIILVSMHVCVYFIHMSFFLLNVFFIMYIIEMHISYWISMSMKIEGKANLQMYFWVFLCKWHARWKSSYNLERIAITWGNLTLHFICIWLALLMLFLFSLVCFCLFFVALLLFFVCLFFYAIDQWSGLCCWWYCQNNWFS